MTSLERLQRRAAKIVYGFKPDITREKNSRESTLAASSKTMEMHCVLLVDKCLVGEVPSYFKDYFILRSQSDGHLVFNKCTRLSIADIVLSKFRLDEAFFYYHNASLFYSLPMNIKILPPMDRFQAISAIYS